ncbi:MAG: hypothetical protein IV085_04850 [Thiobacillus sp.]|nr:hypothetical protein [Thiobacillus sp.]
MKWILIPCAFLMASCDPTPPPQPEATRTPNPVFDTQIQAIEKAKAVEGQVKDAAEAQRRQMDAETQ